METYLKIYTYNGESGKKPFPNAEKQIEIYDFTYDAKRMGGAPTISATVMYDTCLDNNWNDNVFVEFNGEKYFLKNTPTSSKSNTDARFKHELNFVSERVILDNVYFYDVVSADFDDHKPVTNSSKFSFHGDIHQFVDRLNESLKASGLNYKIIVDEGINSEEKFLSFDNSFFSNSLQEIYNVFELPYYFVGKVIHVGYSSNQITDVLKYGSDSALLSITKQNTNNKIVNRITGVGSSENIPYYYPNDTEKGDLCAIASDANTGLKTDEIKIVNPVLFGKRVDLTVDKNNIRPNSIVSYLSGAGNVKKYWVSDNGVDWVDSDAWTYEMKNFVPLDFYIKYEIAIGTAGSFGVKPRVTINDVVRSNTSEVFAYYKHVNNDVDTLTEIEAEDGTFVINANIVGDYELVIRYRIYYAGVVEYVVSFTNDESTGGLPNWYHNGKKINLKDIGIMLTGFPKIGDSFYQFRDAKYIENQSSLMPSIYRETFGAERFYNAENGKYSKADGESYNFNNPFIVGKPKEHIENFEDIKPTIKEATNDDGKRIDMFADVAFDLNDNDETIESTDGGSLNHKHPYFFVKLRKMGFNLFDHAIESGEMTIAVTSGSCGACEFVIVVNDDQKNTVQVDEDGNLVRDENGNVKLFDSPQEKQNDTINNEVWIALRKEESSFGQIMPNSAGKLKPVAGDTFVILNILLPKEYILKAEKRLENALIDYMSKNNDELFTFDVNFSRIYFEENKGVLSQLNENSSVTIEYNNVAYQLYVSSYSYKMSSSQPLPEIKIALSDKLTQTQSALQNTVSQIAMDVVSDSMTSINVLKVGLPYFVRKDIDDIVSGKLRFEKGLNIGNYASGVLGYGATLEKRSDGNTYLEVDYATIRKKATFTEITIQELKHVGGEIVLSPAAIVCTRVEDKSDGYYCYFENKDSDGRSVIQEFIAGDQARCQVFNVDNGSRYYWRLVTDVGEDYIVLSKTKCDANSDIPIAGDNIVQLGNRDIATRQNAQIISSHGIDAPSIKQYSGINDFTLEGKEVTVLSPSGNKITGQINIQQGSTGAENIKDLPAEVLKAAQVGADNILLNSGFVGDYDSVVVDDMDLSDDEELYSPSLKNWNGSAIVQDEPMSKSGKAAIVGDISQAVKLILRENYTISFFAKGNSLSVRVGGFIKSITLGKSYKKYVYNFKSQSTNSVFVLNGDNATIYDLKLERGNIATDWSPSVRDNDKANDGFASIQYLQDAIKNGSTDIVGGLILSSILQVGNYKDNVMQNVTAGVNGGYYEDKSVAFWAGGTLENAINTVRKFTQNQIPTEEDWRNMANFVATHGGEVFMRGYLNALGISLRGKMETSAAGNRLVIDPEAYSIAAYKENGELIFNIDYANSRISLKGKDEGGLVNDVYLSGTGLSFGNANATTYGALGIKTLDANVQSLEVKEIAEIETALIKNADVEEADIASLSVSDTFIAKLRIGESNVYDNFKFYVDNNDGTVKAYKA